MSLTKIKATSLTVDPIVTAETEEVTMGISAKAMQFMIDRLTHLYNKPVDATVRETISNAIDATMMIPAADRQPIKVTSPSLLNPQYIVQDFGIGMSKETVTKVFLQYGESAKAELMNQIGAYGLGAKAPLAYTVEFQVETTFEGITTLFTVSRKADKNAGNILYSKFTGKPSGTKVTVPCSPSDESKFRAAIQVFKTIEPDVVLEIDGDTTATNDYIEFDSFMLDEDTKTSGRVWIHKNHVVSTLTSRLAGNSSNFSVGYVLSGWVYGNRVPALMVELKPGVVDFDSSRDDILDNPRLESLVSRVYERYTNLTNNEDVTRKLLDLVRVLPKSEIYEFVSTMYSRPVYGLTDAAFKRNSIDFKSIKNVSFDVFDCLDGSNPFKDIASNKRKNLYGSVSIGHDYGIRGHNYGIWANVDEYVDGGVTSRGATIPDNLEIGSENIIGAIIGVHGAEKLYGRIVLTDVTAPEAQSLVRSRRFLIQNMLDHKINRFYLVSDINKAERRILERDGVEIYPISEYLTMIKEARKANRTVSGPRQSRIDHSFHVSKANDAVYSGTPSEKTFDEAMSKTITEMIDEDAVILIGHNHHNILMGAMNTGLNIAGRPIYALPNNDFYAEHWKALVDYDDVYLHPSLNGRGQAFEKIKSEKSLTANYLDSEAESLSDDEKLHIVLRSLGNPSVELLQMLQYAATDSFVKSVIGNWIDVASNKSQLSPTAAKIAKYVDSRDFVDTFFSGKKADKMHVIVSVFNEYMNAGYSYNSSLTHVVYCSLFNCDARGKNDRMTQVIVSDFMKDLEEKISE